MGRGRVAHALLALAFFPSCPPTNMVMNLAIKVHPWRYRAEAGPLALVALAGFFKPAP